MPEESALHCQNSLPQTVFLAKTAARIHFMPRSSFKYTLVNYLIISSLLKIFSKRVIPSSTCSFECVAIKANRIMTES